MAPDEPDKPKAPPPAPSPLGAPPSIESGRRWRARHKKKDLSYWLQTALGLVWVILAFKGVWAIPQIANLHEPDAMQEVLTICFTLALVSIVLLVLHFKSKK